MNEEKHIPQPPFVMSKYACKSDLLDAKRAFIASRGWTLCKTEIGGFYALEPGQTEMINEDDHHNYLGFFDSEEEMMSEVVDAIIERDEDGHEQVTPLNKMQQLVAANYEEGLFFHLRYMEEVTRCGDDLFIMCVRLASADDNIDTFDAKLVGAMDTINSASLDAIHTLRKNLRMGGGIEKPSRENWDGMLPGQLVYWPEYADMPYSKEDCIRLCDGNEDLEFKLLQFCTWQSPETVIHEEGGLDGAKELLM